jgi:hypothetical protein
MKMKREKTKATIKWFLRKERKLILLIDRRDLILETKTTKTTTKSNLKRDRCEKISAILRRRLEDPYIHRLHREGSSLNVNSHNPNPSVNSFNNNTSSRWRLITRLICLEE